MRAAITLGLLGTSLLALPAILRVPVELSGPLSAPLGGGLCVAALVLSAASALSRARRARAARQIFLALLLSLVGVGLALGIEWHLVRKGHEDRAGSHGAEQQRSGSTDRDAR